MIQNFMLLPVYEHKDQQFRFLNNCKSGEPNHTFRVPNYALPSFFFKREKRPFNIEYLYVYDLNDNLIVTLPVSDNLHVVSAPEFDGFGYVTKRILNGLSTFTDPATDDDNYDNYLLPCGFYYYKLSEFDTQKSYYSEIFEVVDANPVTELNELVLNGDFSNSFTNWVTSGSWSISGGAAAYAGGGGGFLISQVLSNVNSDGIHFYRFSVKITGYNDGGDSTKYIRVYCNGLDAENSIFIRANGTYTFYFTKASRVIVQSFNGEVLFNIDDISIQKVIGNDDHVSMLLSKSCKFPNSIDKANFNYFNYYLFDALILQPEYGEVLKEEENGDFENVASFVRPFKRHQMEPLLLPEPVADAFAQLNTFDIAEIYDFYKQDIFLLNSTHALTKFRSIQTFNTKFEWQPDGCYQLTTISFEENLALHDKCCDDETEICPCFDEDAELAITVEYADGVFHIGVDGAAPQNATPESLICALVTIWFDKQDAESYTDCNSIPDASINTGVIMPYPEFLANGIDYAVSDFPNYVYRFKAVISQVGCENQITSNKVCPDCIPGITTPSVTLTDFEICYDTISGTPDRWGLTVTFGAEICNCADCILQFWNTDFESWMDDDVANPVEAGNNTFVAQLRKDDVPDIATITKVRIKCGDVYSDEFEFGAISPCT